MSSEVFSTARVVVETQQQIVERLRREVSEISSSISRISHLMQEKGKRVQEGDRTKHVTLETVSAEEGDGEASGYEKADVEELIEAIKQREALLQVSGVETSGEDQTVTVSLGVDAESAGVEEQSGYVKKTVVRVSEMTEAPREGIYLADLLQRSTDKKGAVYQEELLVLLAILEGPVWSKGDLERKKAVRREMVRIDADESMDMTEKMKKISGLRQEYVDGLSEIPEHVDADELFAEYVALLQLAGMRYTEEIAVSHLPMKIDELMKKLQEKREKEFIEVAIEEAFEEEGILLDEVRSVPGKQVFYMSEDDNCEVILENTEQGFLMESVGVSESGDEVSDAEKEEMVESAKKVCEKYRRVVERLREKGIIIAIGFEGKPEAKYLKVVQREKGARDKRDEEKRKRLARAKEQKKRLPKEENA